MNIAIIGAGFSGCFLYHNLKQYCKNIDIFDKARGTGGRLSTKYIEDKFIDYGTNSFDTKSNSFESFLQRYSNQNILSKKEGRYSPTNGMNKVCSSLIDRDRFISKCKITKCYKKEQGWILENERGESYSYYDIVLWTIPAKQILDIRGFSIDMKRFEEVTYDASFAIIAYSFKNLTLDVASLDKSGLFREILDNSLNYKYQNFSSYVLHLRRDISNEINLKSKEEALVFVLKLLEEKFEKELLKGFELIPHFWKLGFVKDGLEEDCFFFDEELGFCGDYFGSQNLESSFKSAQKLLEMIRDKKRLT